MVRGSLRVYTVLHMPQQCLSLPLLSVTQLFLLPREKKIQGTEG